MKNKPRIEKSVESHTLEVHSASRYTEDFPTLLDPEGTLADAYLLSLQNEMKKSGY